MHDTAGFFAEAHQLDMEDYLVFHYRFECVIEPELAAAHLAQEQSTAQWKRVGVDEDFRGRFGAKVIELKVIQELEQLSYPLPPVEAEKAYHCEVRIAHPHGNFGPKIPNLLTAALGEGAFYSPGIASIKLLDIDFPESYLQEFPGPKFGVAGIRDLLEVYDRPLFFGVVKPNLGLAPQDFADLAYEAWLGGLDIAKDDEMLADVTWSPISERAKLTGEARLRAEAATGEKKIYLANITDEVDRLIELHDTAVERGAKALMINTMTIGLSAVRMLRAHTKVPLVAHFDFIAPFTHISFFGVSAHLVTKLQRLVGCDCVIFPGAGVRMKGSSDELHLNVSACLDTWGPIAPALPIPAGSQWAGSIGPLYEAIGTIDFGIVPGRAVFEHPMGPAAGATSLRQGWDAISNGKSLEAFSLEHEELRLSIEQNRGRR